MIFDAIQVIDLHLRPQQLMRRYLSCIWCTLCLFGSVNGCEDPSTGMMEEELRREGQEAYDSRVSIDLHLDKVSDGALDATFITADLAHDDMRLSDEPDSSVEKASQGPPEEPGERLPQEEEAG